jgi:hypothetical protein
MVPHTCRSGRIVPSVGTATLPGRAGWRGPKSTLDARAALKRLDVAAPKIETEFCQVCLSVLAPYTSKQGSLGRV